jgi:hypothetical protein
VLEPPAGQAIAWRACSACCRVVTNLLAAREQRSYLLRIDAKISLPSLAVCSMRAGWSATIRRSVLAAMVTRGNRRSLDAVRKKRVSVRTRPGKARHHDDSPSSRPIRSHTSEWSGVRSLPERVPELVLGGGIAYIHDQSAGKGWRLHVIFSG